MMRTVKDYEKLSEQYNKMLEERNSLIDDLSWYKAKVSRLERENEKYDEQFTEYIDETYMYLKLLSEFSQHIGNKPSSSTYKYFREKLDNLNITEDK